MTDFRELARQSAKKHGLDPSIFERQINAESGFNPNAGSGAGAVGIAQFMPATAASLGINPRDPHQALDAAAKLMAGYVRKFGSYEKALRAYNAGPGAVEKSHAYGETNAYVAKILNGHDPGRGAAAAHPQPASPSTSGGGSGSVTTTSQQLDMAGFKKAQGNQLLAKMFAKQKRGGALLSTGVLSTAPVDPSQFLRTVRSTTAGPTTPSSIAPLQNGKSSKSTKLGGVTVAAGANRAGVKIQKPILTFLHELAGVQGRPVTVTTGTNHNRMTTSGNVSDHWDGNATDLGMGGDARQSPAVDRKGTLVAAHALQLASSQAGKPLGFKEAYAMAHAGGLWNFETPHGRVQIIWKTMTGGDHFNHVHVGVNPHR